MPNDLTLLDVQAEPQSLKAIKKPSFVYADFSSRQGYCLVYLIDSQKCWLNGECDARQARINVQIPRRFDATRLLSKLEACGDIKPGENGVYRSPLRHVHALQIRSDFVVRDLEHENVINKGRANDWIISEGSINSIVSDADFRRNYTFNTEVKIDLERLEPSWRRDRQGLPNRRFDDLAVAGFTVR